MEKTKELEKNEGDVVGHGIWCYVGKAGKEGMGESRKSVCQTTGTDGVGVSHLDVCVCVWVGV